MKFETRSLHAGLAKSESLPDRAVPVHRTAAYNFRDAKHAADLFALKELGYIYTRLHNPTQDVLEQRVASLEGGAAALAVASGTSAIFYSIINIAQAGDEIVSSRHLYGGTFTMFNDILPNYGINVKFVDPLNHDEIKAAINEKTKAVYLEAIGNPTLSVPDYSAIADIAHAAGLPLIIDSTFTTPYVFRGIEHGADIVVHSLTKWLGGHGTGIGGIVVDSGKFNWKSEKFPTLNEPEKSYSNIRFAHDLGDLNPLAYILRMRLVPLRNLGAAIAPDNAWIFLQGIETLSLRLERHNQNALKVAEHLNKHAAVEWVRYPGLKDDPSHGNASKYFENGHGAVVVFGVKGGRSAGEAFINKLQLFSHLANVGDAKSLAIHPASTTHSQLTDEQQFAAGIGPEFVRLSVGIEHIDDLLADLDQALNQ